MKNDRFIVLCVLCMLVAALAGCRGSDSDAAQATDRAQRLYDRAQSLLNDAAHQVQGQFAPLTKKADLPETPEIKLSERGQINPMVDQALNDAIGGLEKALAAEGQPEYDRLLAQAMLARLQALRGYRLALEAAESRRQANDAAHGLDFAAVSMSGLGKRIANYDQLLSIPNEALTEMDAKAKADIDRLRDEITKTQADADKLEAERVGLVKANTTLLQEAGKLDTKSLSVDPVEGVGVFDQAQSKRDQAGKNDARLAQIEDANSVLTAQLADLSASKAAAEGRLALARKTADARNERMADLRAKRGAMIQKLSDVQKRAEQLAARGADAIKAASDVEAKALEEYSKAVKTYEAYQAATRGHAGDAASLLRPDPAVIAMLGDARMARGEVRVRMLLLQRRLDQVVAKTSDIWSALPAQNSAPDAVGQLDDYLAEPDKVREDAQDDFRWAAKVYDEAGKLVPDSKLRWAYVLQKAAANVSLYRLSGDAAAKQEALEGLDSLGAQEQSPNIFPAASDFRQKLNSPPLFGQAN